MESADKYLDEKQKDMAATEKITQENEQKEQEAVITFYVAECSEFPVLGEYNERLETLQEAMELYDKIPAERMNGIKSVGFRLEDGSIYDGTFDLMVAGEVQKEFINEIPHYRESLLVQKAIEDMEGILAGRERQHKQNPGRETEQLKPVVPQKNGQKDTQMPETDKQDAKMQESAGKTEQAETKAAEPVKSAEKAPKTDRSISGGSKKQSVLNALRERQARLKAQEKQGQKSQAHKKGGQEL